MSEKTKTLLTGALIFLAGLVIGVLLSKYVPFQFAPAEIRPDLLFPQGTMYTETAPQADPTLSYPSDPNLTGDSTTTTSDPTLDYPSDPNLTGDTTTTY